MLLSSEPFQHKPLSLYRPQIRLLKFTFDPSFDSIVCHLHHFDFEQKPPYYALSYTWGSNHNQHCIAVNSRAFKVNPNLFHFLSLAHRGGIDPDVYFWIDQICIDQSEHAFKERADQVGRMDKIYAEALQVVVWLGVGDPYVERFMDLVKDPYAIDAVNSEHQSAFDAFVRLPYWGRAWIVQEMYFARHLRLTYGTQSVSMKEVKAAELKFLAYTIAKLPDSNYGLTPGKFLQTVEIEMLAARDLSFIGTSFMLHQKCGRVHDRIYAFQNLLPASLRVEANYQWSPVQLFNALMDKLGETASDHGLSDIEVFANRLDIPPEFYAQTLRRLNRKFHFLSEEKLETHEKCYTKWAPRINPACKNYARSVLGVQHQTEVDDVIATYPNCMFWMLRLEDTH